MDLGGIDISLFDETGICFGKITEQVGGDIIKADHKNNVS
jgi:hypothetical protein